ncbi:hypothetical protein JCM19376_25610 [Fusibacter bizertensis]
MGYYAKFEIWASSLSPLSPIIGLDAFMASPTQFPKLCSLISLHITFLQEIKPKFIKYFKIKTYMGT